MSDCSDKPVSACIDVVLDVPIRRSFSYLVDDIPPAPGSRVKVPFGRRSLVGIVMQRSEAQEKDIKLKNVQLVIDDQPLFSPELIQLIHWTANYYHQPQGEVWRTAMPVVLRKGLPSNHGLLEKIFSLGSVEIDPSQLTRAPAQQSLLEWFQDQGKSTVSAVLMKQAQPGYESAARALIKKNVLKSEEQVIALTHELATTPPKTLTRAQQQARYALYAEGDGFRCNVLEGVTGSGKTEVYFSIIDQIVERDQQVLVLLPEIALTDQLYNRFIERFGSRVVQVHSGLSEAERYRRWWRTREGDYDIVLATRSGVFMEFRSLGLIIVDEEHDLSFKQHEGLRYHARDLAVKRAHLHDVPIILGSATPSLETYHNIESGRYKLVQLEERIGDSRLPSVDMINLNQVDTESGLSRQAIESIDKTLKVDEQVLVYINRRGFAPVLYCPGCQWTARCRRCDAQMTLHQVNHSLQCHHCGAQRGIPPNCDECGESGLIELGEGTQKIESNLKNIFPEARIQRFDRDELSTSTKMNEAMERVHAREIDILVGTQLLSKGHDFSGVSLVLVINADQGLHSIDFRAAEHLVQQLIQVAGRSGRRMSEGRVLIQTALPEHPALLAVQQHDYRGFVVNELLVREQAGFPPWAHIALWRVRGRHADEVMDFIHQIANLGREIQAKDTFCYDPVRSPMFKRGGMYNAQLLISAQQRGRLHLWLGGWIEKLEQSKKKHGIKWSIDVDPVSLF